MQHLLNVIAVIIAIAAALVLGLSLTVLALIVGAVVLVFWAVFRVWDILTPRRVR